MTMLQTAGTPEQIELLAHLGAIYPQFGPKLVDRAETAMVDDDSLPATLITLDIAGTSVHDLFVSDCGRFDADPEADYGVAYPDAARVNQANRLPFKPKGGVTSN